MRRRPADLENAPQPKTGVWVGSYRLTRRLGEGGNSWVWEGKGVDGKTVAVKISKKLAKDVATQRTNDEIRALEMWAGLGVIPLLDVGTWEDRQWYAMPKARPLLSYLAPPSISDFELSIPRVRALVSPADIEPPATPEKIVRSFAELARSLARIHSKRGAHRDIKPANILWFNERATWADFGLAFWPEKPWVTGGALVGSRGFRAPEYDRGSENINHDLADIYSLSKTLWWFLLRGRVKDLEHSYTSEASHSLDSINDFEDWPEEPLQSLKRLPEIGTHSNPQRRPSAETFSRSLEYILARKRAGAAKTNHWGPELRKIFPLYRPRRAVFKGEDTSNSILAALTEKRLGATFLLSAGRVKPISRSESFFEQDLVATVPDAKKNRELVVDTVILDTGIVSNQNSYAILRGFWRTPSSQEYTSPEIVILTAPNSPCHLYLKSLKRLPRSSQKQPALRFRKLFESWVYEEITKRKEEERRLEKEAELARKEARGWSTRRLRKTQEKAWGKRGMSVVSEKELDELVEDLVASQFSTP